MNIRNRFLNREFRAFTLAEVLITLGIIGVVAAMTIPTLLNAINDMQYKSAYKKAYSALAQAITSVNMENGFVDAQTASSTRPNEFDTNFLAIMGKFKVVKQCTSSNNAECWDSSGEKYWVGGNWWPADSGVWNCYAFIDSSGMAWSEFYPGSSNIFVDTNGFKQPNQWGKDRFSIIVANNTYRSIADYYNKSDGIPYRLVPSKDNVSGICISPNKCFTENNYYATSWLMD